MSFLLLQRNNRKSALLPLRAGFPLSALAGSTALANLLQLWRSAYAWVYRMLWRKFLQWLNASVLLNRMLYRLRFRKMKGAKKETASYVWGTVIGTSSFTPLLKLWSRDYWPHVTAEKLVERQRNERACSRSYSKGLNSAASKTLYIFK